MESTYLHAQYIIILEDGISPFFIQFPLTDSVKKDCRISTNITVDWMALVALQSQLKWILLHERPRKGNYRAWFSEGFKSDTCMPEELGCQSKLEYSGVVW